jgi:fatty-acyl-CoA synthase
MRLEPVACSKLGANMLCLNPGFAGPQIADVVAREQAACLIYDDEFAGLMGEAGDDGRRFVAWVGDAEDPPAEPSLEDLIAMGDASDVVPPAQHGRQTILTSGTTGTPKGASRGAPGGLDPLGALLSSKHLLLGCALC